VRENLEKKKEIHLMILSTLIGLATALSVSFIIEFIRSNKALYLHSWAVSTAILIVLLLFWAWYRSSYHTLYQNVATAIIKLSELPYPKIHELLSKIREREIMIRQRDISRALYKLVNSMDLRSELPGFKVKFQEEQEPAHSKLVYESITTPKVLIRVTPIPLHAYTPLEDELHELCTRDLEVIFEVEMTNPSHRRSAQVLQWLDGMMEFIISNTLSWMIHSLELQVYKETHS